MAEIYKIAESWMGVWVRNGPGTRYSKIDVIYGKNNAEYTVTERQNNYWLKIGEGRWCCDRDSNGMIVMVKTGTTSASTVTPETPGPITQVDEENYAYMPDMNIVTSSESEFTAALEDNFVISNIRGIFGMPYQFMECVDPRLSDKPGAIGRKYAKEIVASMPLLLITPGVPVFMGTYKDDQKENILRQFIGQAANLTESIKNAVFSEKFGKYYTLDYAYDQYYTYVNPMCRVAATVMGVQKEEVDGVKLESYNWALKTNENFQKIFSVYRGCTAWYCDSETSISDSFSNSTAPSMLADKINSLSDYGRELNFLLGSARAEVGSALDKVVGLTGEQNLAQNIDNVNNFINGALGQGGVSSIFKTLTNSVQTVVAGGKLVFPEIWSESSFARSYEVRLKLVSPDADDLSIYLNIIVPIIHLLGLVLPREAGDTGHGYISPFLVRGFYKGLFNVDMGIITDMTITKGKESAWTPSGVPSTVDVNFTIKDLYSDIYMTDEGSVLNPGHNMTNNIILMDYISNLCGVNINEVDIYRGIELFMIQNIKNKITDTWHLRIFGSLDRWITNKWQQIFGKF